MGLGERLNTATAPNLAVLAEARQFAQGLADRWSHHPRVRAVGTMPPVHVDLIANPDFNACAFEYAGTYFIGINSGALLLLNAIFNFLLCCPDVLPDVGDVSAETEPAALTEIADGVAGLLQAAKSGDQFVRPPNDPERQSYVAGLCQATLFFLTGHEFAHLRFGHVALMNRWLGHNFILEVGGAASRNWTPLMNQAIEMDADAWGTCRAFESIASTQDPESRAAATRLYFFGSHILFRLLGYVRFTAEERKAQFYPPPQFRHHWNEVVFHELGRRDLGKEEDRKLSEISIKAGFEAEVAFARITGRAASFDFIMELMTQEARDHLEAVLEAWTNDVRPHLVSLSHASDLIP